MQQARVVAAHALGIEPIALQCAEVVGIAEFDAQGLEDFPIAVGAGCAEFTHQVTAQVGDDAVAVQQRVVHIQQKHDVRQRCHGLRAAGRCPSSTVIVAG